jgi:predicted ABC-type ATPase
MAHGDLRRPTDRACERCGRREIWDTTAESWRIVVEDGERHAGNTYCIHEWDINGRFAPFED